MTWRKDMENAPRDGTPLQVKIPGHGDDNAIMWVDTLLDENLSRMGAWCFLDDEPPESWTDGICWEVNESGEQSVQPTEWKLLADERVEPS